MSIAYETFDTDGKMLGNYKGQPCFSTLTAVRVENIASIHFFVSPSRDLEAVSACRYLDGLRDIGFILKQSSYDILENGFRLTIKDLERDGVVYACEVGGHLWAVRYLSEFSLYVAAFLNILHIDPKTDPWKAFNLAHICPVRGPVRGDNNFGVGHALLTASWDRGNPYKPWPKVVKSFARGSSFQYGFSWGIFNTYGLGSLSSKITGAQKIIIKDTLSLEAALLCLE